MKVNKTVQAGIVNLTRIKEEQLEKEYRNLQKYLHGEEDAEVYSANKQQAKRYYNEIKEDREYPISIRKDLIEVRKCEPEIADYFVKVPTAQRYGGLKVPVKTHTDIKDGWEIGESKLYRQDGEFYINITVSYEEPGKTEAEGVLGIDLGLKRPITGVTLSVADEKVRDVFFKGDGIKEIQCKYAYLRRNSGTGKKWKDREHRKVKDQLHKLTTELARKAERENLAVAVGDLKGVQEQDNGKTMNRKLHRFPHYTFRKLLEYKCRERGVQYVEVDEAYTSQTCYKCGEQADRVTENHVYCNGSKLNRDLNGAANIAKRALTKLETKPLEGAGAA